MNTQANEQADLQEIQELNQVLLGNSGDDELNDDNTNDGANDDKHALDDGIGIGNFKKLQKKS